MTQQRDLDRVLDRWMDHGPTVVADRVIAAAMTDVHTTRQVGARWAPLKELFMTMKPALAVVGITVVAVIALAAFQILGGGGIGAPRAITADDLPVIVLPADEPPPGMGHDRTIDNDTVPLRPIISVTGVGAVPYLEQPGYLAGRYTEFSHETAGLLSWAALFETTEDAQRSLDLYVEEVEADAGYALGSRADIAFGDEGGFWSDDDPENNIQVILWRSGTLVMAVATYGDFDPDSLRSIAEAMDDRAN